MSRIAAGVLAGVLVSASISALLYLATPDQGVTRTLWQQGVGTVGGAVLAVGPGFVAGWIAKHSGAISGVLVAAIVTVASAIAVRLMWGQYPASLAVKMLVFGLVASAVTQSVAGLAGEWVATRRGLPPNNSSKPTPLRGAA